MRIALDTNVLVSGFLNPAGSPGRILDLLLAGEVTPILDDRILAEYRRVLPRPKFGLPPVEVSGVLRLIEGQGEFVSSPPAGISLPDPDDVPFLEVAISGSADSLVTGNLRHFPRPIRRGLAFRIQAPTEFLKTWMAAR